PEYRGYLGSAGLPGGLRTDTENVRDAINALKAYPAVDFHRLYLLGYSMGGGVALTLAAELPHVRAVVCVSPYVGMKTVEAYWAVHPPAPGTNFARQLGGLELAYGKPPSQKELRAESPDTAAITAPVLLLQGTGDSHVEWQTVQAFANAMQALHKTVKLILYPGGPHGLHTAPYGGESTAAMSAWFAQYGLNIPY
ncbi:MAG: alpha/beta hydrolase family protein, partial [Clostridia bacterium]